MASDAKQGAGTTVAGVAKIPAPELPDPNAALAAPLTGQGVTQSAEYTDMRPAGTQMGAKPVPPKPPKRGKKRRAIAVAKNETPAETAASAHIPSRPSRPAPPVQQMGMMDPAIASLMQKVLDTQHAAAQTFSLVIVPDDDWPQIEEFSSVQLLVDRIKSLLNTPCHLFPFLGHHLSITSGPNRFLHTPMGTLPLFDIPNPNEVGAAECGWVGETELPDRDESVDEFIEEDECEEESSPQSECEAEEPEGGIPVC